MLKKRMARLKLADVRSNRIRDLGTGKVITHARNKIKRKNKDNQYVGFVSVSKV